MNSKATWITIILAVGIIIAVGIYIAVGNHSGSTNNGSNSGANASTNTAYNNADANTAASNGANAANNSANNSAPFTGTGCPNGQDVTQTDANGRMKPTMDISNKSAVVDTDMGSFTIQFYDQDAPKTVENFICLAQKGYFNNTIVHRVAHDFVAQMGDPTGTGTGGQSIYGKEFEDELFPDTTSYKTGYLKGVVAMANHGPNTNGSQFFVMLSDHADLAHNYTIFGKIIAGQSVIDKIGGVKITPVFNNEDGKPVTDIHIKSVTIQ